MSRLPVVSGRECVKTLQKAGFVQIRQRGSHIIMQRDEPFCLAVVPDHKQLDRGTLRSILREAGISVEQFLTLLS